ncbi:MAG: cobyric acid synthase [Thermodesulfovibrionales bacterium]|nr:cobyric acid synthase [Thermodesulfovibrionales bacterium]
MAKSLMIQGTGSGAGKSLLAAALCRIFKDGGIDTAPFKAQNMALNSYITLEGGEIGRAQALQAEAARIEPSIDMNPILLKASGEAGSQVIIHGKVHSTMKASEYYAFKKQAWKAAKESFDRLSKKHELIIMEGAGSPAEINLMDADIVNMSIAKYADAPVILVGDIDKGGVFASLYGTIKLLGRDSRHIKGFVINKFRGDMEILRPGLEMIKDKTGKPVIGVLPYIKDIGLPEEDGLSLCHGSRFTVHGSRGVKIVVVRLQYISNFTDFDPFAYEPDVEIVYSRNPAEIENADMVIIPGSKNTVKDLLFLKECHLDESIKRAYKNGIQVIGMCGGYQMLGKKIYDPHGIESPHKKMDGLGLLNIETTFGKEKTTCRVEAELNGKWVASGDSLRRVNGLMGNTDKKTIHRLTNSPIHQLRGYEIHMGTSTGDIRLFKIKRTPSNSSLVTRHSSLVMDGSKNNNCWGTYIHGIFENDSFRRETINQTRKTKGLNALKSTTAYSDIKDRAIDSLASIVKENIGMNFIKRVIGL